jgi:hypothetical protein
MADYLEWDIDNPKHRQRRPRQPPILEGEILEPQPEPRISVTVEQHHRSGFDARWILLPIAVLLVLRFLPAIGVALIVLLALAFTYPLQGGILAIWLACVIVIIVFDRRRRIAKRRNDPVIE